MSQNIICVIFVRAGSKTIKNKNIQLLDNFPLLEHSIFMAKKFFANSNIYISTNSKKMISIAIKHKINYIVRPNSLCGDNSKEWNSWKHAVKFLKKKNINFKKILSLPTTSPMRKATDIKKAISLSNTNCDAVISVTNSTRSPYWNMTKIDKSGYHSVVIQDKKNYKNYIRRQNTPKTYDMTTVVYIAKKEYIENSDRLMNGKIKAVLIPSERAIDIDTNFDLKIARYLFNGK